MSGDVAMRHCTGCCELGEYGSLETLYPWSIEHQCRIGAGCDECGGTGMVEMLIPTDDDIREMLRNHP